MTKSYQIRFQVSILLVMLIIIISSSSKTENPNKFNFLQDEEAQILEDVMNINQKPDSNILQSEDYGKILKSSIVFKDNVGQKPDYIEYYLTYNNFEVGFGRSIIYFHVDNMQFELEFLNSDLVKPIGVGKLDGITNYLIGDTHYTNIGHYEMIQFTNIYDGINLSYVFSDKGLKYEFVLEPHADLESINMVYKNVDNVSINNKLIEIEKNGMKFTDDTLSVWYTDNHEKIDMEFVSKYSIDSSPIIQFHAQIIDHSRPITIDPYFLSHSTFIGGNQYEIPYSIVVDKDGNVIVGGLTNSTNYPTTSGSYDESFNGGDPSMLLFPSSLNNTDMYISKFTSDLSTLLFSTYIGGSSNDYLRTIKLDDFGDLLVLGQTRSDDFPTVGPPISGTYVGGMDIVFFKLSNTGETLQYSTYIGGNNDEDVYQYSMDLSSSCSILYCKIYLAGRTISTDFPVENAINSTFPAGTASPFILVFETNLNGFSGIVFSTFYGGTTEANAYNYAWGCFVDSNGHVIAIGTADSGFPTTPNAYQSNHGGGYTDHFMIKLSADGGSLLASTYLGGSNEDQTTIGGLDSNDNVIIGGYTKSTNYPTTTNAFSDSLSGGLGDQDITLSKLSNDGSSLIASTYVGGESLESVRGFAIDNADNMYISYYTTSSDYPLTSDNLNSTFSGSTETMLTKISSDCTELIYSTYLRGVSYEITTAIALADNNIYMTGITGSPDFVIPGQGYSDTLVNDDDSYIIKLTMDNTLPEIQLTSLSNGSLLTSSTDIEFTITDDYSISNVFYGWDGLCKNTFDTEYVFTAPSDDGQNILNVCAEDHVGNWKNSSFSFVVDDSTPQISLSHLINNSYIRSGIDIQFNIDDLNGLDSITYSWNNGDFLTFPENKIITSPSTEGSQVVKINATDNAGNSIIKIYGFNVDNTAPTVILNSPEEASISQSGTKITFDIDDSNSIDIVYYSWDNGEQVILSNAYELDLISGEGTHTLAILAKDIAGNWNNGTYSFITDDVSPTATITGITDGSDVDKLISIEVDPSDENGIKDVQYLVSDDVLKTTIIAPHIWVWDTGSYQDGSYKITIIITDVAGNEYTKVYTVNIVNDKFSLTSIETIGPIIGVLIPIFGFIYVKSFKFRHRGIIDMYKNKDLDIEVIAEKTGKTKRQIEEILKKAKEL